MRNIYLHQTPRAEALALFMKNVGLKRREEILNVNQALGRVTARPVFAKRSWPGYHAAAMDGIVVRAEQTFGASDQQPQILYLGTDYYPVDTGEPLPEGFDAVIKIEEVQPLDADSLEIIAPASPWQHVRPVGEDIVEQEMILPAFHRLSPVDIGALLAGGVFEIAVFSQPLVAIIPTGDELASPEQKLKPGEIPEFNSAVIRGFLEQWGAVTEVYPKMPDDPEKLINCLQEALSRADLVIVNAGSSAGSEDFTSHAVKAVGELLVHGVATRPGKPTILGSAKGKALIGLPGYPVSAYLALEWFARPLLHRYFGLPEPVRPRIRAVLGRRIVSQLGVEEFIRVSVGYINGNFIATPLGRGAGVTMSLVKAHGLLVIPPNSLGFEQGTEVEIELYRTESELKKTLVAVGSHDLALDLLGVTLKETNPELSLSSTHLGSMGGLNAIRSGQAHLSGIHLFDSATGEYNIPFIKRFLKDQAVVLVNLTYRTQGWIVAKGNPLGIHDLSGLLKEGVRFVNRQRGAGTRLLFDYLLEQAEIGPDQIYGYQREEFTHLNVAAAVAAGVADVGLGINSAAQAYGLEFIPVAEERYDLLMTRDFYHSNFGQVILQIITAPDFKSRVEGMGGYSMRDGGRLIYQQ